MKNYEQPKIVVKSFLQQDVLLVSTNDVDDFGAWGGWFNGGVNNENS